MIVIVIFVRIIVIIKYMFLIIVIFWFKFLVNDLLRFKMVSCLLIVNIKNNVILINGIVYLRCDYVVFEMFLVV